MITRTQPKVPEAKVRGSQEGFQCVLVSPERVPGVRKGCPMQPAWEKQALYLSQGVQAGRKALRMRYIDGVGVRKKRPRGFKKEAQGGQVTPLNPRYLLRPERDIAG